MLSTLSTPVTDSRKNVGRRGNGEGTIYRRSDMGWGATLTGLDGRRRTVYAATRQQVQDKLKELVRQRDQGLLLAASNQRVGDYLRRWLQDSAKPGVRPRTYDSYELQVRRLQPLIGSIKLSLLSPAHVQNAYAQIHRSGLSPASVQRVHMVLHRAMRQAVV